MTKITRTLLILVFLLSASFSHAGIIPIDLNTFSADPTVLVSTDGSSATLSEGDGIVVFLFNDSFFSDGTGIDFSSLMRLKFAYNFILGESNIDDFYARVYDGITFFDINDFRMGDPGSGSVAWDLQGLEPSITLLGLEFSLNSYEEVAPDSRSSVEISNVQLEYSVSEPGTLVLLFSGLMGLMGYRKKIH